MLEKDADALWFILHPTYDLLPQTHNDLCKIYHFPPSLGPREYPHTQAKSNLNMHFTQLRQSTWSQTMHTYHARTDTTRVAPASTLDYPACYADNMNPAEYSTDMYRNPSRSAIPHWAAEGFAVRAGIHTCSRNRWWSECGMVRWSLLAVSV